MHNYNINAGKRKGGGYVLNDYESQPGKVVKCLRHTLSQEKAGIFLRAHEEYVRRLSSAINVQPTRASVREAEGGRFRLVAVQDDLHGLGGCTVRDYLCNGASCVERKEAIAAVLGETLEVYRYSTGLRREGILLGIDANVGNWWMAPSKELIFIDTVPPAISVGWQIDADMMLSCSLREIKAMSAMLPKSVFDSVVNGIIVPHYFDWPRVFADFALFASAYAPKLRMEIVQSVRDFVAGLPQIEKKELGRCLGALSMEARFRLLYLIRELSKPKQKSAEAVREETGGILALSKA